MPQQRLQNYSQRYYNPSTVRSPNVQMQFNKKPPSGYRYQTREEQLKSMQASKQFQNNANHDYNVRRSGGWREHPLSTVTQRKFEHLPSAEKDHIEKSFQFFVIMKNTMTM